MVEQREFSRVNSEKRMQVYTSLCAAAYTVAINDISPKGAFVKTQHLPKLGETISFNVCDERYNFLYSGSGKVVRIVEGGFYQESGFAVEFDSSIDSDTFNKLLQ